MSPTLSGVLAPVLTPFQANLEIDVPRFVDHCRSLLADGCSALAVFGTTSEANSLSVEERERLLLALLEAGIPPEKLLPGTGCCALPDTVRLTRAATRAGCAGVLMLPPFYYKNLSDEAVFRSFAAVIDRVADPRLRIFLYHIPNYSQVGIPLAVIQRLRKAYPEIVVGLKDSSGDFSNTRAILDNVPGFQVFVGSERYLLANLRAGGAGCITAGANPLECSDGSVSPDLIACANFAGSTAPMRSCTPGEPAALHSSLKSSATISGCHSWTLSGPSSRASIDKSRFDKAGSL